MTTKRALSEDMIPSTRRITALYRQATPEQLADGLDWYQDAHSLALALDPANVERAAGVIAALSPRVHWNINVKLAVRAYADGQASKCMPMSANKANAILGGADVAKTLKGPKTVAFAQVIADPTDPHAVVIDRHAMSVAIGRCATDDDYTVLGLKGVYEQFADAYRRAARIIGVSPSQVQAVTWVVWRETKIRTAAANRRDAGRSEGKI